MSTMSTAGLPSLTASSGGSPAYPSKAALWQMLLRSAKRKRTLPQWLASDFLLEEAAKRQRARPDVRKRPGGAGGKKARKATRGVEKGGRRAPEDAGAARRKAARARAQRRAPPRRRQVGKAAKEGKAGKEGKARAGPGNAGARRRRAAEPITPAPAAVAGPTVRLKKLSSTYGDVHSVAEAFVRRASGGTRGLRNLGNTCFLNAAVQCLAHCEPMADYFLGFDWRRELNRENFLGSGGKVAEAFGALMAALWAAADEDQAKGGRVAPSKALAPSGLKNAVAAANAVFSGRRQHDAQEFLTCLLDLVHEDLNRVGKRRRLSSASEERSGGGGGADEVVAAKAWAGYLCSSKSIVVDLWQGQLRSSIVCTECGAVSKKFDPFMSLSLPIPVQDAALDLQTCVQAFCREELLEGDEAPRCGRCEKRQAARKRLDLWKLPPVLMVHLKRFRTVQKGRRLIVQKVNTPVDFPVEQLDLSPLVESRHRGALSYDLFALACHKGGASSGHYTAISKHRIDGKWRLYNDHTVTPQSPADIRRRTSEAYVLFYRRMQAPPRPDAPPESPCTTQETPPGPPLQTPAPSKRARRVGELIRRQSVSQPHLWPHVLSSPHSLSLPPTPSPLPSPK